MASRFFKLSKLSRLSKRLVSGLGVLVLTLILLEIALRLLSIRPGESPVFVETAERGLRVRPGIDIDGLRTNSRGFNDREWTREKPVGVARLAVIGDSFVVAAVPREEGFAALLQQGLEAVEVMNMGIAAAGPETYASVLENEAAEFDVDHVVVMVFVGNDIAQSHPDFKTRVFFGAPRELLRHPLRFGLSVDHFYSLRLFRAARRTVAERWSRSGEDGPGTFSPRAFLAIERQRLEICRADLSSAMDASYARIAELLIVMARTAAEQGMSFTVVLAPDQFQVDEALARELFDHFELDPSRFDLDQPQELLRQSLARDGIAVLDLLDVFRAEAATGTTLYLPRDSHWNAAGNVLAAEAIRQHLLSGRVAVHTR